MKRIKANRLIRISRGLDTLGGLLEHDSGRKAYRPQSMRQALVNLLKRDLPAAEFRSFAASVGHAISLIDGNPSFDEMRQIVDGLRYRLEDEIATTLFFHIERDKKRYLESHFFDVQITERFPSVRFELKEAALCFALDRSTACVFHLARSLEIPLRELARKLHVTRRPGDNWDKILGKIDRALKDIIEGRTAKPRNWRSQRQFYSEASAMLRSVKDAWRNPVMHLEATYTAAEADQIISGYKGIIHFLAQHLSEGPADRRQATGLQAPRRKGAASGGNGIQAQHE